MIIRNLPFLTNHDGLIQKCFTTCDKIIINLSLELKFDPIRGFRFGFDLYNNEGQVVFRSFHDDLKSYIFKKGLNELQITIPNYLLKQGDYVINIISGIHNAKWLLTDSISLQLNIINNQGLNSEYNDYRPGNIIPLIKYE